MCEKIMWGVYGLLIGMGVSAVIVATNKKVQNAISDGAEKATDKFNEVKDATTQKIKAVKKAIKKPASASRKTTTTK